MKKAMMILIAAFLLLNSAGCVRKPDAAPSGNGVETPASAGEPEFQPVTDPEIEQSEGEALYFETMKIISSDMSAQQDVIEAVKTQDGVQLLHYLSFSYWDAETQEEKEDRQTIREISGDAGLYEEIAAMAGRYGVESWDGFRESDPDVLDGEGFLFHAVLSDGRVVEASGSNAFPDGFRKMRSELEAILAEGVLENSSCSFEQFSLTFPESWVGEVHLSYARYGLVCFYLPENGEQRELLEISTDSYYYWANKEGRFGRLETDDGETVYLSVFRYDAEEAETESILGSLQPADGWTFYPEDGSMLYTEDARTLFEDARSLWLNLFLGGEYASGTTQAEIGGRQYRTFSASYDSPKITTIDACREKMETLFTEAYTEQLIARMVENRDLLEHQGNLYIPMRKIQDIGRYAGYRISGIEQDADRAELYLTVHKAGPEDELYSYSEEETFVFTMEQSEDGVWRFSDYPYWDK